MGQGLCPQDQNLLDVLSGKVAYAFVECGEDQIVCNRHAEQVCICNLLVTVQTPEKGLGQRAPVSCARVIVVARMEFHLLQQPRGFVHAEPAGPCGKAQESTLHPRAERPFEAGCLEPLRGKIVMFMALKEAGDQQTLPSPFQR